MPNTITNKKIIFAIIVAALGYFVDAYDIVIFSVIRIASLKSLGLTGDEITTMGAFLINCQLIGMILGGVGWGILGDKLGRLQVLFGSIALYSLANFANAYVSSIDQYALCRFFGGIGLAGEVGAGITLVSELMSKEKRGYGTMLVAFVGLYGVSVAGLVGDQFTWQTAYITGGIMGLVLLMLRISVAESGMFQTARQEEDVKRGDLRLLLGSWKRLGRYICCILTVSTLWMYLTIFVTFAPEIGRVLGIADAVKSGQAMFYVGIAFAVGSLVAGFISQKIRSRKKVLHGGIIGFCLIGFILLSKITTTPPIYYAIFSLMGFSGGYWSVFLSLVTEQFGTNIRATVTTSVPNFMRALGILHTTLFIALKPLVGVIPAIEIILGSFTLISLTALWFLRETFGIDLNFVESDARD